MPSNFHGEYESHSPYISCQVSITFLFFREMLIRKRNKIQRSFSHFGYFYIYFIFYFFFSLDQFNKHHLQFQSALLRGGPFNEYCTVTSNIQSSNYDYAFVQAFKMIDLSDFSEPCHRTTQIYHFRPTRIIWMRKYLFFY